MSKEAKIRLIKYTSAFAFVAILAYIYIGARDFAGAPLVEKYWMICDALTIPGIVLIMAGALVWVSNMGALDGLGYAVSSLKRMLIPGAGAKMDERYAEYVERKRNNRVHGYGFLLISGCITMAAALVFMALFFMTS